MSTVNVILVNLNAFDICTYHYCNVFNYAPPGNQLLLCVASVVKKKLYCIVLYCIALHCFALHCIALYCCNGLASHWGGGDSRNTPSYDTETG